jgi:DNA polymerase-4
MTRPARYRAKKEVSPASSRPSASSTSSASILHVDMDAFFVSVEELYNPGLKGRAVIVGGRPNERGVVSAASYEARKFGVHSAMPLRTAGRLCSHAIFLPGNHERYSEWSEKVFRVLESYSPIVEMTSIDEGYVDLTGTERLHGPALAAAHRLREEIWSKTHLPCSMGLATTRLVAKVASDLAKPCGLLWVPPGAEAAFLAPLAVRKIPGIGPVTERALNELAIQTVGELAAIARDRLEEMFGEWGWALYRKARGEDAYEFYVDAEPKSISNHHTFAQDTDDPATLDATLSYLSQKVGQRLREEKLFARTVTLILRYASFRTHTRAETLKEPTELDAVVYASVRRQFERHWDRRQKVRLLGVHLGNLTREGGQISLMDDARRERIAKLTHVADRIRERFGFDKLQSAKSLLRDNTG